MAGLSLMRSNICVAYATGACPNICVAYAVALYLRF